MIIPCPVSSMFTSAASGCPASATAAIHLMSGSLRRVELDRCHAGGRRHCAGIVGVGGLRQSPVDDGLHAGEHGSQFRHVCAHGCVVASWLASSHSSGADIHDVGGSAECLDGHGSLYQHVAPDVCAHTLNRSLYHELFVVQSQSVGKTGLVFNVLALFLSGPCRRSQNSVMSSGWQHVLAAPVIRVRNRSAASVGEILRSAT